MFKRLYAIPIATAGFGLPALLAAHHSFPITFNTSRVTEIRGPVLDLRWSNPHVTFLLRAEDGERWLVESNSTRGLERFGIGREALTPGTVIRVAGFPARNGDSALYSSNLLLADGVEYVIRPGSIYRWSAAEGADAEGSDAQRSDPDRSAAQPSDAQGSDAERSDTPGSDAE